MGSEMRVNIFSMFSLGKDRSYLSPVDVMMLDDMMLDDVIGFHGKQMSSVSSDFLVLPIIKFVSCKKFNV